MRAVHAAQFGRHCVDAVPHVLTDCEVVRAVRPWAVPLLLKLLGLPLTTADDDGDDPSAPFSTLGFARFLAYGGDSTTLRHPAAMALRGACLCALRTARLEAHASFDDRTDAAQRRADDDDIDQILGVLPALATTGDAGGWTHDRAVARAKRELAAHVTTDWHVACGGYTVHPDCAQIRTLRPTSRDEFIGRRP